MVSVEGSGARWAESRRYRRFIVLALHFADV